MADTFLITSTENKTCGQRLSSSSNHNIIFGIFFIVIVTLLAYSSIFSADFIWDDDAYVTENVHLLTANGLNKIWFSPGSTPQYYPLVFTIFWIQYHLYGFEPFGYHLVNILLHTANALLLWRCASRINIPGAFWAAAIFAVHPVHLESVAWITELKNVLSTFFYFLSFLAFYRFNELSNEEQLVSFGGAKLYYSLALLAFIAALFSKTVSGSLPAAIILIFWWKQGRFPGKQLINLTPFFILAVIAGKITTYLEINHVGAKGIAWDFSFIERVLIAGRAVWFYAAKIFWPYPLMFNYPRWQIDTGQLWQYFFPLSLVLLFLFMWCARNRIGTGPLVAFLFFVGSLFPALSFFNVFPMLYSFVADHFQYLASIGLILLFCAGCTRLFKDGKRGRHHRLELLFFGVVLAVLSALTWQHSKTFENRLILFSDVIAKNPDSWMSYVNRGFDYFLHDKYDLALADYQKALELNPLEAGILVNRSELFAKLKNYDQAFLDVNRAIAMDPSRYEYYLARATYYCMTERFDLAINDYNKLVQINPDYGEAYVKRALLYAQKEDYIKALSDLNKVADMAPNNPEVYANRGLIYYRQGLLADAVRDFDTALRLDPGSAATHFNRGLSRAAGGDVVAARSDLLRARELGYELDDAEFGLILSRKGTGSRGK